MNAVDMNEVMGGVRQPDFMLKNRYWTEISDVITYGVGTPPSRTGKQEQKMENCSDYLRTQTFIQKLFTRIETE